MEYGQDFLDIQCFVLFNTFMVYLAATFVKEEKKLHKENTIIFTFYPISLQKFGLTLQFNSFTVDIFTVHVVSGNHVLIAFYTEGIGSQFNK